MTTQSLETECTTEIEFYTPEDKTHVERKDTTHEERQSEYNGLLSEHLTKSSMNQQHQPCPQNMQKISQ